MNSIKIRTTQNVEVEYPMASLGDRIIAYIIDGFVLFAWMMVVVLFNLAISLESNIFIGIMIGIPYLFYHLLCEVFLNGQSVGKMARNIKVIKLSGEAPALGDYLMRWIFRLVDISLSSGLVAIIAIAASQNGQRLGDMAAGTCVIKKNPVQPKDRVQLHIEENYQIQFPEVNLLTDKDIALIRKLLQKAQQHNNYELLEKMTVRVKETTGIQTDMPEWEFLQTVVKDYYHFTHGDVSVQ